MILLITNKEDVHPTPVIAALKDFGVELFRFNTEALLSDYDFWWKADSSGIDFYLRDIVTGREIYGHDVTAVWERRPMKPETLRLHASETINEHNLEEARGFLSFLLYFISDKYSIGDHDREDLADSKLQQMKVAQRLGLLTPVTILSNSKKAIEEASLDNSIIIKPISHTSNVVNDDTEYVFYGQKVSRQQLLTLPDEAFTQTVTYLQSYIEKKFELRITVVGNDVFAAKIDSQFLPDDKGKIDWRQGYDYGLHYEAFNLPEDIKYACINYLRQFHLNFGAFDFIVTPDDEYVFLECNPNGQWMWIEIELPELKIARSIASHLINAGRPESLNDDVRSDIDVFMHIPHSRILQNEDDLKHQLAAYLRDTGKYDDVILEYYIPREMIPSYEWKNELYIDIVVRRDNHYLPIELKYKTKRITEHVCCFGKTTKEASEITKEHGAHNDNLYNVWKDVRRIEHLVNEFETIESGIVLFLTNDPYYLKEQSSGSATAEFSLSEKRSDEISRHWLNNKGRSDNYRNFEMNAPHKLEWHKDEAKFSGHSFCYLVINI